MQYVIFCFFLSALNREFLKKDIQNQKKLRFIKRFCFQLKQLLFRKQIGQTLSQICMDTVTYIEHTCTISKQINKVCVISFCYYYYSIINELVVYFVSYTYKKMVRNDKTLFVKLSCNTNFGTCVIYPLYNSIDKHEKTFFSHSRIVLFIYF